MLIKLKSIMTVLHDKKLLTNIDFNIVTPVHQNKMIDAEVAILSNKLVYENLWINQTSDDSKVIDVLKGYGKELDVNKYVPEGIYIVLHFMFL